MIGVAGKDLAPLLKTLLAQLQFVDECHIQVGGEGVPGGLPGGLGGRGSWEALAGQLRGGPREAKVSLGA